jgi:hypothetical protein
LKKDAKLDGEITHKMRKMTKKKRNQEKMIRKNVIAKEKEVNQE